MVDLDRGGTQNRRAPPPAAFSDAASGQGIRQKIVENGRIPFPVDSLQDPLQPPKTLAQRRRVSVRDRTLRAKPSERVQRGLEGFDIRPRSRGIRQGTRGA